MKKTKLASFLAVTISFELMVAPIVLNAHAAETKKSSASDITSIAVGALGGLYQQVGGGMNSSGAITSHYQMDMNGLMRAQAPQPDKLFNPGIMTRIPGLAKYLKDYGINPNKLNCTTLDTTTYVARPEVCEIGVTNDRGIHPMDQINAMGAYKTQYFKISELYKNHLPDSNSAMTPAFGMGCMNEGWKILNAFFMYRLNSLHKLNADIEQIQNDFREKTKADLLAIDEATAVLDGDSEIANEVRTRRPELFDFDKLLKKKLQNDEAKACSAMFAGDKLTQDGRRGGLNFIQQDIQKKLTDTKGGKYSGDSYMQSHSAVVEEINTVADKLSKEIELNFMNKGADPAGYFDYLSKISGTVSSTNRVQNAISMDLITDARTEYNEKIADIAEARDKVLGEIPRAANIFRNLGRSGSTFDVEVDALERDLKNQCFNETLVSIKTFTDRIKDSANPDSFTEKYANNLLKEDIEKIMSNSALTMEAKLALLKSAEARTGNRYDYRADKPVPFDELDEQGNVVSRVQKADPNLRPSTYIGNIVKSCNARFKKNKLKNELSGADAIKQLKKINSQFKSLAKSQASNIKREVRKKLVECENSEIANNTVAGSCGPGMFNPSTPGFCANAAFDCSKKMKSCTAGVDKYVAEIKKERTDRVNNYKNQMIINKAQIVKIFDEKMALMGMEAQALNSIFNTGYTPPIGIQREVPDSAKYLTKYQSATAGSPDGTLLLEDPDKYVEMFKANIPKLISSVKAQQDGIAEQFRDHMKTTKNNYKDVIDTADKLGKQCDAQYKAGLANSQKQDEEMMKKQTELGEKQKEFCRRYSLAVGNRPTPACQGDIEALVSIIGEAANDFQAYCDGAGNSSEEQQSSRIVRAITYCKENPSTANCDELYKACQNEQVEKADGTKINKKVCDDETREAVAGIILKEADLSPSLSSESAPAYCSAGTNENRNSGKSTIEAGLEGINQGLGNLKQ